MTERAAPAGFTYKKLLKRLAPAAVAVAACLSLLLLGSWTNQHEWAVGWLRRRFEGLDLFPFTFWTGLERGGILIALSVLAALIRFIRQKASPTEQETDPPEKPKLLQRFLVCFASFFSVNSPLTYALQVPALLLLKLLGAGVGTLAAASVCVCAAFIYKKKGFSRWLRTLQGAVGGVYTGFAFAHWVGSSWWTALWTTAALYAVSLLTLFALFTLAAAALQIRDLSKDALEYWKWTAGVAVATALWLWFGGSLEWTVGWLEHRYMDRSAWSFCWRIAVERVAVSLLVMIAIHPFKDRLEALLPDAKEKKKKKKSDSKTTPEETASAFNLEIGRVAFKVAAVAPVGETIALQALIIAPLSALGADIGTQTVVSALLFALAHWRTSPVQAIVAGLPCGVYFGFMFAFWYPQSIWTALWVTALSHSLTNLLTIFSGIPIFIFKYKAWSEKHEKKKSAKNDGKAETDAA
ncbi:MAG: hypothetical protein OXT69_14935 [Candidatus Poribacteria bacterium]|nr:hypothetical protein [Candidatus Poribacteria bacterium]